MNTVDRWAKTMFARLGTGSAVLEFAAFYESQLYNLKVISARAKYEHEQHVRRWERWAGRSYPLSIGEIRRMEGVTFREIA